MNKHNERAELKPCQFCGHVGLDFNDGSTFRWIVASCGKCGASRGETRIQTSGEGTKDEWMAEAQADAIREWNQRAAMLEAQPAEQANGQEAVGAPYGIIDPDYARIYTQARIIAWQYGYACVMHGSFTRDLDLLLVPWADEARDNHDQLLKLIASACGLRFKDGVEEIHKATVDWSEKPHGRKACSLYFPAFGDQRWVDVSVVPRSATPPAQPAREWVGLKDDDIQQAQYEADISFRKWRSGIRGQTICPQDDPQWHFYCAIESKLREKNAGLPAAAPDGCVLVPVEPTREMLVAGKEYGHLPNVWAAMLAAAPKQQDDLPAILKKQAS